MAKNNKTKIKKTSNNNDSLQLDNEIWSADFQQAELSKDIQIKRVFDGFSMMMPNPDPVLKKMGWNKDVEAYKEILSDPQLYGAIENNRKPGVTRLTKYIDNPNAPADEVAFFKQYFEKLDADGTYDNLLSQSLDTPYFGRMLFGIVWDNINGKTLPKKIISMPHELCKFDTNGKLLVSEDGVTFDYPSHPARFIVLQHKPTAMNPYGEATLSKCFWNVRFKKDGLKLWALFIDKFGMPFVTASYNPAAIAKNFNTNPQAAANILLSKLSGMARNGVIAFPDGAKIDIKDSSGTKSADHYEKLIRLCDEQNTKLILGHSSATETSSGGKLGNENTATDVRDAVVEGDKRYPEAFFNKLISFIHHFNFNGTEIPKYSLYAEEDVDLVLAERDAKLVPVLMNSGLKLTKSYYLDNYGFKDEDLEDATNIILPTPIQKPIKNAITSTVPEFHKNTIMNKGEILAQSGNELYNDQVLIDDIADIESSNTAPTDILLKITEKYLKSKKDYPTALKDLAKAFPEMNSDQLQKQIEKIMFFSDLVGRFSAKDEMEHLNG